MNERLFFPPLLNEIADVIGAHATLKLVEARGGSLTYIPATAPDGHWLVGAIGRDAADKLCAHFRTGCGGMDIMMPLGSLSITMKRRQAAEQMTREGVSRSDVARRLGIHTRTVQRYRARMRDELQG